MSSRMPTAVERWQALIDARANQMDAAYAQLGRTSADFWDRRARGFHRATRDTVMSDPLFLMLSDEVTAQTSVLDVGAGTGRFSLALAPHAKQIIAVEPNAAMLDYLRLDVLYEMGIYANVRVVALPPGLRYPSLDVAVEESLEQLILPGDEQTRSELHPLLEQWLIERDGMLVPPVEKVVSAIIYWTPLVVLLR